MMTVFVEMSFGWTSIGEVFIDGFQIFFLQDENIAVKKELRVDFEMDLHQTFRLELISSGEEILVEMIRDFRRIFVDLQRCRIDLFDEEDLAALKIFRNESNPHEVLRREISTARVRRLRLLFDLDRCSSIERLRHHFDEQLKIF